MRKTLVILICFFVAVSAHSRSSSKYYQVDIIVFTHSSAEPPADLYSNLTSMVSNTSNVRLSSELSSKNLPYHLRPFSTSSLKKEYYILRKHPQYQILFHYSWLQANSGQRAIELPALDHKGWTVNGTLRIRKSNYFLLDADLVFSNPQHARFVFSQKQRLMGNTLYYLDHSQAGMLIKISPA